MEEPAAFSIPKSSFTAFRLTYASAAQASQLSKCIFLGKIPDVYSKDEGPSIVSATSHYAKSMVKNRFKSAAKVIRNTIRSAAEFNESIADKNDEEEFNIFSVSRKGVSHTAAETLSKKRDLDYDTNIYSTPEVTIRTSYGNEGNIKTKEENFYSNTVGSTTDSSLLDQHSDTIESIRRYLLDHYSSDMIVSPVKSYFNGKEEKTETNALATFGQRRSIHYSQGQEPRYGTSPEEKSKPEKLNSESAEIAISNIPKLQVSNSNVYASTPEYKELEHEKVSTNNIHQFISNSHSFDTGVVNEVGSIGSELTLPQSKRSQKSKDLSISIPHPTDKLEDKENFELAEREYSRFIKRLRHFADASKGRARRKKNDMRNKIYEAVIKNFKAGEILQVEKMLVLTKELDRPTTQFTDEEEGDSRVFERWTEQFAVLRKTDSVVDPLVLQFYHINSVTDDAKNKPEFEVSLLSVDAYFYSDVDRTISILCKQKSEFFAYLMRTHDQISAFRWLYFIKSAQGEEMDSRFRVYLPNFNFRIDIRVPDTILERMLEHSGNLNVKETKYGYSIEYGVLIQYLKTTICNELQRRNYSSLDSWANYWFCFRQYDRLEWIQNNCELTFIQNQLMNRTFAFEFRDLGRAEAVALENGNCIGEPIPVEGFLSRLTNTKGKSKSLLRSFYKVSYFYTCDNIMFYTKYYRASPPTLEYLKKFSASSSYTDICEHCPYPLNEKGHISWLNKEDFESNDKVALSEMGRRAEQVIKSEAMIDLCLIKEIRKVPVTELTNTQKLLMSTLWHSNSALADDVQIIDSAFEIEMINGSIVRLQAQSSFLRDHWILNLQSLRDYWFLRKQRDLRQTMIVRARNEKALRIPEYVDSNINRELNNLEFQHSVADPRIQSIESIAMSKCILMSGYLYQKSKKHSNFSQYFVILCPAFIVLYSIYKRRKTTGAWKASGLFEHHLTIPLSSCYIYSGAATSIDLLNRQKELDPTNPARQCLPRLYPDGWKSSEEEEVRCFTLWIGRKRKITKHIKDIRKAEYTKDSTLARSNNTQKNPGMAKMIKKLGFTGRSIVFMARSRQEREIWTSRILTEIDRYSKQNK
ncbi:hypothetical protein G9P44_005353 [Scheffersomyces stipitis]|nr:hypothetical protein G9P44_005353 [Scheffersomyces stipitis]